MIIFYLGILLVEYRLVMLMYDLLVDKIVLLIK